MLARARQLYKHTCTVSTLTVKLKHAAAAAAHSPRHARLYSGSKMGRMCSSTGSDGEGLRGTQGIQ